MFNLQKAVKSHTDDITSMFELGINCPDTDVKNFLQGLNVN